MHKTTHQCGGRAAAIPIPNQKNDIFSCPIPSLQPYRHDPHHRPPAITPPFMVTVVAATSSWLRNRRIRYLFLILCSPLLFLLFCAALPFICVAELCLRRGIWRKLVRGSVDDERLRRCEEGYCRCGESEGVGLLQRYLEDQLLLVGSVYECGDEEDDEEYQFKGVEDVENPEIITNYIYNMKDPKKQTMQLSESKRRNILFPLDYVSQSNNPFTRNSRFGLYQQTNT